MKSTLVMKFGGKALENPDNFQKIVSIIQKKTSTF